MRTWRLEHHNFDSAPDVRRLILIMLALLALLAVTGCEAYPAGSDSSASGSQFGGPPSAWVQYGLEKGRDFWINRVPFTFPQVSCYTSPDIVRTDLDNLGTGVAGAATGCLAPDPDGNPITGDPKVYLDNDRTWTRNAVCVVVVHEMGHLRGWGHTNDAPPTVFGGPTPPYHVMDATPHIGDANCPS